MNAFDPVVHTGNQMVTDLLKSLGLEAQNLLGVTITFESQDIVRLDARYVVRTCNFGRFGEEVKKYRLKAVPEVQQ